MRNSVVRSLSDNNFNDADVLGGSVVSPLLARPRTASPSLRRSSRRNSAGAQCSITVIGRQLIKENKNETTSSSSATGQRNKKDTLEALLLAHQSAGSDAQRNASDLGDIAVIGLSPAAETKTASVKLGKPPVIPDLSSSLPNKASHPLISRNNSFTDSLTITSGSVLLANRPASSLCTFQSLRRTRPKTAAVVVHRGDDEITGKSTTGKDNSDLNSCTVPSPDTKEPNSTKPSDTQELIQVINKNLEVSDAAEDGSCQNSQTLKPDSVAENVQAELSNKGSVNALPAPSAPENTITTNLDNLPKNSPHIFSQANTDTPPNYPCSETGIDITEAQKADEKVDTFKARPSSGQDKCTEQDFSSQNFLTPRHEVSRTTSQERALSPIRFSSPDLKHHDSDEKEHKLPNVALLSLHSADSAHENTKSSANVTTSSESTETESLYTKISMAKVELFDRWSPRQPRLSIAEEIRRQNMMLEEKNSELRRTGELPEKIKFSEALEQGDRERAKSGTSLAEKGNVCGSPGFKAVQGQLRNSNVSGQGILLKSSLKVANSIKTSQDSGKKNVKDVTLSVDKDKRLVALRPLSDYVTRESQESLFVSGGNFKSGERSLPSKISLQDSGGLNDLDTTDNTIQTVGNQKVRVSLAFLKEKNGLNAVGFRHRLDGNSSFTPRSDPGVLDLCIKNTKSAQSKEESSNIPDTGDAQVGDSKRNTLSETNGGEANANGEHTVEGEESSPDAQDSQPVSSPMTSSSGTPTAAFSSSDLLYGTDGLPRPPPGDDLAGSDISGYERDRQRLRDLEIGNKRPPSKGKRGSYSLVDKVSFDREREEGRVLNNSLPAKPPTFRSNGIRSSLVRGEQLLTQRNSNPNTGRESDDLIAMGTLWSPANNNNNSGGSSGPTTRSSTTASNKSAALVCQNGSNNNNNNNSNNNSNGSSQRKPISMSTGKLSHSSSFNGLSTNTFGRQLSTNNNNTREDPKYPDPLQGAPASFQQRLMELASLEAETIRWERTKRVKKKPRQDRDS